MNTENNNDGLAALTDEGAVIKGESYEDVEKMLEEKRQQIIEDSQKWMEEHPDEMSDFEPIKANNAQMTGASMGSVARVLGNFIAPTNLSSQYANYRTGGCCRSCGAKMLLLQPNGVWLRRKGSKTNAYDHIYPASKGWLAVIGGLQLLCDKCNSDKSDMPPVAFVRKSWLSKVSHATHYYRSMEEELKELDKDVVLARENMDKIDPRLADNAIGVDKNGNKVKELSQAAIARILFNYIEKSGKYNTDPSDYVSRDDEGEDTYDKIIGNVNESLWWTYVDYRNSSKKYKGKTLLISDAIDLFGDALKATPLTSGTDPVELSSKVLPRMIKSLEDYYTIEDNFEDTNGYYQKVCKTWEVFMEKCVGFGEKDYISLPKTKSQWNLVKNDMDVVFDGRRLFDGKISLKRLPEVETILDGLATRKNASDSAVRQDLMWSILLENSDDGAESIVNLMKNEDKAKAIAKELYNTYIKGNVNANGAVSGVVDEFGTKREVDGNYVTSVFGRFNKLRRHVLRVKHLAIKDVAFSKKIKNAFIDNERDQQIKCVPVDVVNAYRNIRVNNDMKNKVFIESVLDEKVLETMGSFPVKSALDKEWFIRLGERLALNHEGNYDTRERLSAVVLAKACGFDVTMDELLTAKQIADLEDAKKTGVLPEDELESLIIDVSRRRYFPDYLKILKNYMDQQNARFAKDPHSVDGEVTVSRRDDENWNLRTALKLEAFCSDPKESVPKSLRMMLVNHYGIDYNVLASNTVKRILLDLNDKNMENQVLDGVEVLRTFGMMVTGLSEREARKKYKTINWCIFDQNKNIDVSLLYELWDLVGETSKTSRPVVGSYKSVARFTRFGYVDPKDNQGVRTLLFLAYYFRLQSDKGALLERTTDGKFNESLKDELRLLNQATYSSVIEYAA